MSAGPHLVIVGAAGFTNYGDDAILAAMLAELRAALPGARFTVAGGDPVALPTGPDVVPLALGDKHLPGSIAGADLLIVGGGGLFYDHYDRPTLATGLLEGSPDGTFPYYRAAVSAHLHGVPVFFYGVGVGPLLTATGRRLARTVLSLASAISVRDPLSLRELGALGVHSPAPELTADPAVGLPVPRPECAPPGARQVGFIVRPWLHSGRTAWSNAHAERYLTWLAAAADHAVEHWDAQPVFLPFQRRNDDDLATARAVLGRMHHAARATVRADLADYRDAQAALAGLDALVSTRLHGLILGGLGGVPLVGIPLDGKVRAFLASLGLAECCRSPWTGRVADLTGTLDHVLADPAPMRARLATGLAAAARAAARNPAIAAALLGGTGVPTTVGR